MNNSSSATLVPYKSSDEHDIPPSSKQEAETEYAEIFGHSSIDKAISIFISSAIARIVTQLQKTTRIPHAIIALQQEPTVTSLEIAIEAEEFRESLSDTSTEELQENTEALKVTLNQLIAIQEMITFLKSMQKGLANAVLEIEDICTIITQTLEGDKMNHDFSQPIRLHVNTLKAELIEQLKRVPK